MKDKNINNRGELQMLNIGITLTNDLNRNILDFLNNFGEMRYGGLVPFFKKGEKCQMITDSPVTFSDQKWREIQETVPRDVFVGRALLKIKIGESALVWPMNPKLEANDENQVFGFPGIDLEQRHSSVQFILHDLWQLLYPPMIKVYRVFGNEEERLVPLGAMPKDDAPFEGNFYWGGSLSYSGMVSSNENKRFYLFFTWNLGEYLPQQLKLEFNCQEALLIGRDLTVKGMYDRDYYKQIEEPKRTPKIDAAVQVALQL